ncbi:hypothetical protein CNR22_04815 [Sphingobacteriaceae bacterium]|nr:hypothetical protein CNR22_04815 [Sphingobacteriaceae bacterium]
MRNIFFFILALSTFSGRTQTLKVNINSIRSDKGNIRLAFYKDSKSFDDEKAFLIKTIPKTALKNGTLAVSYNGLKPGTYGIAILDDENINEKMDYGMVLPKEGFGFSNYFHTGMSRPKFESFDFTLDKADVTVEIKVKYM